MTDIRKLQRVAQDARAEHARLHTLIDQVRIAAEEADRCVERWHDVLIELRQVLAAHFRQEEEGGWLEEAVALRPALAHQLTAVERQHRQLLARLDGLVDDARLGQPRPGSRAPLEAFLEQLLAHERLEERILQEGFNADLEIEA